MDVAMSSIFAKVVYVLRIVYQNYFNIYTLQVQIIMVRQVVPRNL